MNKIYCLTQFNSASLNRHLSSAYNSNVRWGRRWGSLEGVPRRQGRQGGRLPGSRELQQVAGGNVRSMGPYKLQRSRSRQPGGPHCRCGCEGRCSPSCVVPDPCSPPAARCALCVQVGGYNSRGFVEVLAASQTTTTKEWFQVCGRGMACCGSAAAGKAAV